MIAFNDILLQMQDLYNRKNHDYGNSYEKSLDEDGLIVAKIRLGDKFNRFKTIIKSESEVKDESIEDTLIDMANYAVMTLTWIRNKQC